MRSRLLTDVINLQVAGIVNHFNLRSVFDSLGFPGFKEKQTERLFREVTDLLMFDSDCIKNCYAVDPVEIGSTAGNDIPMDNLSKSSINPAKRADIARTVLLSWLEYEQNCIPEYKELQDELIEFGELSLAEKLGLIIQGSLEEIGFINAIIDSCERSGWSLSGMIEIQIPLQKQILDEMSNHDHLS